MSASAPEIEILLELPAGGALTPGHTLRGGFRLNTVFPVNVKNAELLVFWRTDGKGVSDDGVVFRQTFAENAELDARRAFPFEVKLPSHPWSYDGTVVKVGWFVTARVVQQDGKELYKEEGFRMEFV